MIDEKQYQLGIRQLSPHKMVELICGYRNELRECMMLLKELRESELLGGIQKMVCEQSIRRLYNVIHDYRVVIEDDSELIIEDEEE
ncbi:MAG: hypothetical protein IJQ28_05360 [Clostridia bacterium]|nr:hypothetical protein [Clostridia bacterium]